MILDTRHMTPLTHTSPQLTEPALLTLGASHSPDKARHLRAVLLTTVLWMLPIYMSATIRTYFDADIWLLIVITSCLLTSVQVHVRVRVCARACIWCESVCGRLCVCVRMCVHVFSGCEGICVFACLRACVSE